MSVEELIPDLQSIIVKVLFDLSTPLHRGSHAATW